MTEASVMEVSQQAQRALISSPIHALRDLRVERSGASLLISGSVSSYYHKQLAQEAVRTVAKGFELVNSIQVQ